jgi:hypothetical protein
MHYYRPVFLELEERALPNVLADPLGVAGLDVLLAATETRHLAHLVSDVVLPGRLSDRKRIHCRSVRRAGPRSPWQQALRRRSSSRCVSCINSATLSEMATGPSPQIIQPPPPPHQVFPVAQFDASSWPVQQYPTTEIGPPPGDWGNPPYWFAPNWNQYTNAFEWSPPMSGITGFKVALPQLGSYTLGPVIETYSSYTGQDVAGCWSAVGVRLQVWTPGAYAVEVDFTSGAPYLGFVTVLNGGADGQPAGVAVPYKLPTLSAGAIVISAPSSEIGTFTQDAAKLLPNAPRASEVGAAVTALNTAFLNNHSPIDAMLVGHGGISTFQFDTQWMGRTPGPEQAVEQTFAQGLRGEIRSLTIFSCYTGLVGGNGALIKQLAQDLHAPGGVSVTVRAFTSTVFAELNAIVGKNLTSNWGVASNGQWETFTCSNP